MARSISGDRSHGIRVVGSLGPIRAAPVPALAGAQAGEDGLAKFTGATVLGAGVRLFARSICSRSDSVLELAVPESCVRGFTERLAVLPVGAAGRLGSRIFLLGLDCRPVCLGQESAGRTVRAA